MDVLKKLFPYSFNINDTNNFVIKLIVYVVVGIVAGTVIGLLSAIPLVGWLFSLVGTLVSLYVTVGLVLTILVFCKVLK